MSSQGWVKFHRKIFEWEWYNNPNTFRLFFHLIVKANHKDACWQGIEIKRGQLVTSRISLSNELCLTEQKIRTSLKQLISTNDITIETTNKYSLVTIVKYEEYQKKDEEVTSEITNKTTINQPTNNQQITTNKNVNNVKNEKKKDTCAVIKSSSSHFIIPTIDEVDEYCKLRNNGIDAQHFIDYYEARGWRVGKANTKMVSWQATVRTWETRNKKQNPEPVARKPWVDPNPFAVNIQRLGIMDE